jgi:hypothetical protein
MKTRRFGDNAPRNSLKVLYIKGQLSKDSYRTAPGSAYLKPCKQVTWQTAWELHLALMKSVQRRTIYHA